MALWRTAGPGRKEYGGVGFCVLMIITVDRESSSRNTYEDPYFRITPSSVCGVMPRCEFSLTLHVLNPLAIQRQSVPQLTLKPKGRKLW